MTKPDYTLPMILLTFGALSGNVLAEVIQDVNAADCRISSPVHKIAELRYDEGCPSPHRDDPGPDWIFYDSGRPTGMYEDESLWSRVTFTTENEFRLMGVSFLAFNQGPNPDASCFVRVYSENQNNHDLTDLLWEGFLVQLNDWDIRDMDNNWHWLEIEEDEQPEFEEGEDFSVIYGPAPGGEYDWPLNLGDGWWNAIDGATEVNRSWIFTGDQPSEDHDDWRNIRSGDLLIRANGEYIGPFVDLGVTAVYNAAGIEDRKWIVSAGSTLNLFAEITNFGFEVDRFDVRFQVFDFDGEEVLSDEVHVRGIDIRDAVIVQCREEWVVEEPVGHYLVMVTVDAEDDIDEDNDMLSLEQVVFDQEESRGVWIGYVDDDPEGVIEGDDEQGWCVMFDHPGSPIPLRTTGFRVGLAPERAGIECEFSISVMDNESEEIEQHWRGTAETGEEDGYIEIELEENEEVTFHDGQALLITYFFVNDVAIQTDFTPPIAGTAEMMPAAMMVSLDNGESYVPVQAGDYAIQVRFNCPDRGGRLFGRILDAADDSPIEGASVATSQDHLTFSDDEGQWEIPVGPRGVFDLVISKAGYNDSTVTDLELDVDEEIEVNVSLLHPEFAPSDEEITEVLGQGLESEAELIVSNTGNGTLSYSVEKRSVDAGEDEPWDRLRSFAAGEGCEDEQLQGVVYFDSQFFVSGSNRGEPLIYILDRWGEMMETIPQVGEDEIGLRDLAWDGELIWGVEQQSIYGFTPAGEGEAILEGPYEDLNAIAWDHDRQLLWTSSTSSDITAVDRDGNVQAELDRLGIWICGLAYWSDDPDGFQVYVFSRERLQDRPSVYKYNADTGESMLVTGLNPPGGGLPCGAFITGDYARQSWVFIGIVDASEQGGDDRIDIWHLDYRMDWFSLEPMAGVINAGAEQIFDIRLNAGNLPFGLYEGLFIFHHNAVEGCSEIPVRLRVIEGPVHTIRRIPLEIGWNMISANLQPDEEDVTILTRDLVEAGSITIMKDGFGHSYWPAQNFNNIPGWFVEQGYQIRMTEAAELPLEGTTVMADDPIELLEGWQIISYYPNVSIDPRIALTGIVEQLIIVKDGFGDFYIPEWDFSNMDTMCAGRGYQVKMDEVARLVYTLQGDMAAITPPQSGRADIPACPGRVRRHFGNVTPTGENMSLLVTMGSPLSLPLARGIDENPPPATRGRKHVNPPTAMRGGSKGGAELSVFTSSGILVGSGTFDDEDRCGVAVWGDDLFTPEIDGASAGERLQISLADESGVHPLHYSTLSGSELYATDALWVVGIDAIEEIPSDLEILSMFPNPFNSTVQLVYSLPEAAPVEFSIFDLRGRCVTLKALSQQSAGTHTITFESEGIPSGIYFAQLSALNRISRRKITLLK